MPSNLWHNSTGLVQLDSEVLKVESFDDIDSKRGILLCARRRRLQECAYIINKSDYYGNFSNGYV